MPRKPSPIAEMLSFLDRLEAAKKPHAPYPLEVRIRCVRMRDSGFSTREISLLTGVSEAALNQWFRSLDLHRQAKKKRR